jgi:YgiT-type zinc finger domain-containing protein
MNNLSNGACPGEYIPWRITHLVKHDGNAVVFENVPAEVCDVCGDTLLALNAVEAIEAMLRNPGPPVRTVPVYHVPDTLSA